jgi:hypothetical protein
MMPSPTHEVISISSSMSCSSSVDMLARLLASDCGESQIAPRVAAAAAAPAPPWTL